jgi:aquaporin Z
MAGSADKLHVKIATASATPPVPGQKPDRPLSGDPHPHDRLHPHMYAAEMAGTALLVAVGLSIVIALWGTGAPLADLPLAPGWRRLLNGFLFGSVGAAIAYSPIGKISGAHINPAMTFAFWLQGKLRWRDASGYVLAQLAGAALGAALRLAWGEVGASNGFGASVPDRSIPLYLAMGGEVVCTFSLVALVFFFAGHPALLPYTPLVNPPLFAILSFLEAPFSGASANPARSFGPELVGWAWSDWWIYWAGPGLGAALAVAAIEFGLIGPHRPRQARLSHFGHPGGIFHR